jgi:xylulokinase
MPQDFIIAKMCGAFITDHTMASGTLAYDINSRRWCKEMHETFGIEAGKLPEIKISGTPAGNILPEAAEVMGLPENVVVSVGGQDQKCAALGAGIKRDIFTVSLGTATAVEKIFEFPITDTGMRIPVFSYLFKDRWVMEGVINTSGASLKWLKNTFFDNKSYRDLDNMVEETGDTPSNVFFYPLLSGANSPGWYRNSKGCFYGITLSTSPTEIVKSVMEGIAYQIKSNIRVMEKADKSSGDIRIFGGGASSRVWCRMIANVTGKKVLTLYTHETACIGAAILAGLGACVFNNEDEAGKNIKIKEMFKPDKDCMDSYEQKYREYIIMQEKIMK